MLSGPSVDEIVIKADGLACAVHELEVRSREASLAGWFVLYMLRFEM